MLCAGAAAQGRTRGLNFFVWNFAWDRLASRLYAATATDVLNEDAQLSVGLTYLSIPKLQQVCCWKKFGNGQVINFLPHFIPDVIIYPCCKKGPCQLLTLSWISKLVWRDELLWPCKAEWMTMKHNVVEYHALCCRLCGIKLKAKQIEYGPIIKLMSQCKIAVSPVR